MSKIMISIPQELLEEFDRAARAKHKRRSELLKDLVFEYLHSGKGEVEGPRPTVQETIRDLREFTFHLESGETTEGLIRKERGSH